MDGSGRRGTGYIAGGSCEVNRKPCEDVKLLEPGAVETELEDPVCSQDPASAMLFVLPESAPRTRPPRAI